MTSIFIYSLFSLVGVLYLPLVSAIPLHKKIDQRKNQLLKQKPITASQIISKKNPTFELVRRPIGLQLVPLDGRQFVKGLRYNQPTLSERIAQDCRQLVWAKKEHVVKEISDYRGITNETASRRIFELLNEHYGDNSPTILHLGYDIYMELALVRRYLDYLSSVESGVELNPQERELLIRELRGYYDVLDKLDREVNIVMMGTDVRLETKKRTAITGQSELSA